jgi:hypothetical protein
LIGGRDEYATRNQKLWCHKDMWVVRVGAAAQAALAAASTATPTLAPPPLKAVPVPVSASSTAVPPPGRKTDRVRHAKHAAVAAAAAAAPAAQAAPATAATEVTIEVAPSTVWAHVNKDVTKAPARKRERRTPVRPSPVVPLLRAPRAHDGDGSSPSTPTARTEPAPAGLDYGGTEGAVETAAEEVAVVVPLPPPSREQTATPPPVAVPAPLRRGALPPPDAMRMLTPTSSALSDGPLAAASTHHTVMAAPLSVPASLPLLPPLPPRVSSPQWSALAPPHMLTALLPSPLSSFQTGLVNLPPLQSLSEGATAWHLQAPILDSPVPPGRPVTSTQSPVQFVAHQMGAPSVKMPATGLASRRPSSRKERPPARPLTQPRAVVHVRSTFGRSIHIVVDGSVRRAGPCVCTCHSIPVGVSNVEALLLLWWWWRAVAWTGMGGRQAVVGAACSARRLATAMGSGGADAGRRCDALAERSRGRRPV